MHDTPGPKRKEDLVKKFHLPVLLALLPFHFCSLLLHSSPSISLQHVQYLFTILASGTIRNETENLFNISQN